MNFADPKIMKAFERAGIDDPSFYEIALVDRAFILHQDKSEPRQINEAASMLLKHRWKDRP